MFLQIYNTDTQWFIFALIRNEVKRRIFLFSDPQNCAEGGTDMKTGAIRHHCQMAPVNNIFICQQEYA